ncbi:hypothetical protein F53441_11870 [Fusarium austroafricanum]|uniref:Uncharacterized protein n=1 Tax=Fusarium austroafricanum TaxID=2364996 RepID=A0A8H4JZL9_9HYPO|nr:hypothetical protein F53441_11870 [Fusarium austroafricanum]
MAQPPRPSAGDYLAKVPDPEGHALIPELHNCAPAIFCPIGEKDKLEDSLGSSSVTKLERLRVELDALKTHAASSRDNMLALAVRERERIFQEGRRMEAYHKQPEINDFTPDIQLGLSSQDLGAMIANMEAAPPKTRDLNSKDVLPPTFDINKARTIRERQAFLHMNSVIHFAKTGVGAEREIACREAQIIANIKQEQLNEDRERRAD